MDGYGKATGSPVELEHTRTNYLLEEEPMATYEISMSEANLFEAVLNQVLEGQA